MAAQPLPIRPDAPPTPAKPAHLRFQPTRPSGKPPAHARPRRAPSLRLRYRRSPAAGNVYTGLKAAFIDGGSITAALLGFTFFTTFRNLARKPYSAAGEQRHPDDRGFAAIMGSCWRQRADPGAGR